MAFTLNALNEFIDLFTEDIRGFTGLDDVIDQDRTVADIVNEWVGRFSLDYHSGLIGNMLIRAIDVNWKAIVSTRGSVPFAHQPRRLLAAASLRTRASQLI